MKYKLDNGMMICEISLMGHFTKLAAFLNIAASASLA